MGIVDESWSDGDFTSVFASAANERRAIEERRQTQMLLRMLDELDEKKNPEVPSRGRVEYLRVGPSGDIIRDEEDKKRAERRNKVMTVDQLPKESEYEMLFGKPQPIEPQFKVETGRRLQDGKEYQNIAFPWLDNLRLDLGNMRFETFIVIAAAVFFVATLLWRLFKRSMQRKMVDKHRKNVFRQQIETQTEANIKMNMHIEQEVDRRVNERLASMMIVN